MVKYGQTFVHVVIEHPSSPKNRPKIQNFVPPYPSEKNLSVYVPQLIKTQGKCLRFIKICQILSKSLKNPTKIQKNCANLKIVIYIKNG